MPKTRSETLEPLCTETIVEAAAQERETAAPERVAVR